LIKRNYIVIIIFNKIFRAFPEKTKRASFKGGLCTGDSKARRKKSQSHCPIHPSRSQAKNGFDLALNVLVVKHQKTARGRFFDALLFDALLFDALLNV